MRVNNVHKVHYVHSQLQILSPTRSPGDTHQQPDDSALSVAISAASAEQRVRLERLARSAGVHVVSNREAFQFLLLALDSSTPLPISETNANLPRVNSATTCAIWFGDASQQRVTQFLRAGIGAVLSADIDPQKFRAALHALRSGLHVLDPELLREPQDHASSLHSSEDLTAREQEVFTMMGRGLSNKEIAAQLAISTHTVKFHISSILGKLGAASRTEAVSLGIKSGKLPI